MFIFYIPGRAVAKNLPLLNSSANPAQFVWIWAGLAGLFITGKSQTTPTILEYIF